MITLFFTVVLNAHILSVTSGKFFMYDDQCAEHGRWIAEIIKDKYSNATVRWQCSPRETADI
jgi:protoheme ferro-lyase